ncbi:MAG: AraC family transcriptional regulator [Bacteroidota bacterium]
MGIALECGFKSKSTFYPLFKQYTGYTPSAYQKAFLVAQ